MPTSIRLKVFEDVTDVVECLANKSIAAAVCASNMVRGNFAFSASISVNTDVNAADEISLDPTIYDSVLFTRWGDVYMLHL